MVDTISVEKMFSRSLGSKTVGKVEHCIELLITKGRDSFISAFVRIFSSGFENTKATRLRNFSGQDGSHCVTRK